VDSTLTSGLIGVGGLLLGIAVSEMLAWVRGNRSRQEEKRLLAGALAAELKGFLALWSEIEPPGQPATGIIITWAVEQSYSSVFDTAGPRLFILGPQLITEVSVSYFKLKRALDNLRMSQRITEYVSTFGRQLAFPRLDQHAGQIALKASEGAIETGRRAVGAIEELLPKLDAVADGRERKRRRAA
jgi:hypothetical protein